MLGVWSRGRGVPQRISTRIQLKPAQQKVLAALRETGSTELTRGRYQALTGVSRSQAAYDIADLVAAGILERIGGGRSTRYRVAATSDPHTTQRRWTSERIRDELARFCAGRTTWPTAREFKRAGRTDLYVAASRYGGVRFWADTLGLSRESRAPLPVIRGRRWSWAASGAVAGALAAGAAVAIVQPWTNSRPQPQPARVTVVERQTAAPARRARPPAKPRREQAAVRRERMHTDATAPGVSVRTVAIRVSPPPAAPRITRVRRSRPAAKTTGPVTPLAAPPPASSTPEPLPAP